MEVDCVTASVLALIVIVRSITPAVVVIMILVLPSETNGEMIRHTLMLVSETLTRLTSTSGLSVVTVAPRKLVPLIVMQVVSPALAASCDRLSMVGGWRQFVLRVILSKFPTASYSYVAHSLF